MAASPKTSDCIDPPIAELLALFEAELSDLSFPGVDARTLEASAAAVRDAAAEVERLRAALQEATTALHDDQKALREHARRAHAYAVVYASDDDTLAARLDGIALRGPKLAPKKKRARRKKGGDATPQLKLEGGEAGSTTAAA